MFPFLRAPRGSTFHGILRTYAVLPALLLVPFRSPAGSPEHDLSAWSRMPQVDTTDSPRGLQQEVPDTSPSMVFSTIGIAREGASTPLGSASAGQDSPAVHLPPPHLLPESLSPVEHILWGERGVLRTTGIAPYTVSARKSELAVRRGMLTVHQIGGFVTLGLLVPTLVYGQRNLQNWNDAVLANKPFNRQLNRTHIMWADLTFISYVVTGALAILSPPPLIRRNEGSTVSTHKFLAWIHFVGMMAMPILGSLAAHAKTLDQANTMRTIHEIVGYSTAAALATAMIVITF